MFKNTLREIKGSLGRWLAILAIVALGVGFFAGLKACRPAFLETCNSYLSDHNFFDYRLISTLGLEEEDVEIINQVYQVDLAEGSYSADVLVCVDDAEAGEIGTHFLTISKNINTPSLVAGKIPAKGDECLGDAAYFTEADIGKKILVSTGNKEDTLNMLAYDTYTITGIANSPLYLNFERGSASIGDGSIACFLMIPGDGFSSQVFTEIYVKLSGGGYIFSSEYEEISDSAKKPLEEALKKCSDRRYDAIVGDARKRVEEGEAQLAEKKNLISAAESEIASGEEELKGGQQLLEQGQAYYDAAVSQYEETKSFAYKQLEEAYNNGLISEEAYKKQKEDLDQQFKNTDSTLYDLGNQMDKSQEEMENGIDKLKDAKAEISDGKSQIAAAEKELADARKEIDTIEHPTNYVLGRDTNIGYVCFDSDTSIVDGIAKVFPIFFFLVAALVCMTTMSRMVEEHRTQIGVLKSLGYSVLQILFKYVFYSGSSALLGGMIGFYLGTYLFTWIIWIAYGMMYNFADITFVIDQGLGFVLILASLLCSVGTTVYSCYQELLQVPATLIRPKAPPAGKRIFLERITFIWKRLKFLHKVSARNIFRYKKRFFMMILGICGCTALLVAGFGVGDSVKNVVAIQYEEILDVDYTVTFNKSMSEEDREQFLSTTDDIVSDCLFLYSSTVDAHAEDSIKSVNLVVCNENDPISNFVDLHNEDGKISYPGKGEGVINSNLAQVLNLQAGDQISVFDSDMKEIKVKITALCDNYVYNYLYINQDTYSEVYGSAEINSAYVQGLEDEEGNIADLHGSAAKLMDTPHVSNVSVTEDFRTRIENTMASLDYVIALVVACAGALAFIVLYNLTNINITERIREIATIKVLGFYPRETSAYVFRENIVLTAISALVGLPLGTWLHSFIMNKIQIDLLNFDVHVEPLSYALAVAGTFIFAAIVNMVMSKKIEKISMTESLKSIE